MKTEGGGKPTRRWIRERRGAIEAKFDRFAAEEDEEGLRYWLIYEAELDEESPAFRAALDAWHERVAELRARRPQRRR